ncbi:TPA: Asp-tRNA(Asn)/Glu-tRNA(Gln) amidotransferase GatCAB subunit A [candidate division CPR2 bacterium]|uniref:Glutamyl-tRNA(Gln) amidotransferase subunit A n=1 Tax=candidate division CPR2 bacterium GW2011_GWC1_41_48 TaxID=1618344 RepID=A0A0G0W6V3_UNCC2|nr:MAG: Glutamyl-tRNA(Gln) amidotransferase subunit A [candidate division CPR2 bacterium GW2011_GWC2_39_35]KKR28177.1 MAG: Glutamyl-tRNA(Gln) amidotransferase subunit A [candidate division CPR2 bacterium GW2011_GWD2_39_7]KKS08699.1 MAG: Glutamyl-tRNA(Gln) amidotransferase subunit A [candidate division CPR2 bacterium GW2011_GWC1_41_48]OGB72287.1 MAG: aspartyl/glutamyl-tRNA amidotransferase subunit A [candidate division CPR2 bacterium GWD2_39_7]HBG81264.1 Asp-tRNA(Asn)/Glu-tRNA(Gln) amidotransfer
MLSKLTLEEAIIKLDSKEISSEDLTRSVLSSIENKEKDLNAYITVDAENALNKAKLIDTKRAKGEKVGKLAGVPVAIKDIISTKDLLTTAGSKILSNYIPPFDATVTKKLKEADTVIVGKTNMDEFAMGSSTETSYYGPTKNPRDLTRVPGGSSGGSAAAVAADETIFALGTDTGGSIRQPASFCGVVGLKPTYGRVSRRGVFAMGSSLDQVGPITKTVKDAAIALEVIAGKDKLDSTSVDMEVPEYSKNLGKSIKGMRIGLPQEYFEGLDSRIAENIHKAVERLASEGAQVVDVSLPYTKYALAVYYIIMPSEVSANLAKYDGIKYGYSAKDAENLMETYLKSRAKGFGPEPKRRIMIGAYALSSGYYEAYYLKAQKVRALVKQDYEEVFKKVDVLVTPTSPVLPFKIGEKMTDPLQMYLADVYTVPVNIAGIPAISVPANEVMDLPVGMQIIGPQWEEEKILNMAYVYEQNKEVS